MFEDIITFDQACEFLGVSPKTLYGYTYKKIIPYYRPRNRHVYFRKSELAEFVTSNRIAPVSELAEQAHQMTRKPAAV